MYDIYQCDITGECPKSVKDCEGCVKIGTDVQEEELMYWTAPSLYDGGWRSSDREDLIDCYGFTEKEIEVVIRELKEMEGEDGEVL
jgi:hypothetical protein